MVIFSNFYNRVIVRRKLFPTQTIDGRTKWFGFVYEVKSNPYDMIPAGGHWKTLGVYASKDAAIARAQKLAHDRYLNGHAASIRTIGDKMVKSLAMKLHHRLERICVYCCRKHITPWWFKPISKVEFWLRNKLWPKPTVFNWDRQWEPDPSGD